MMPSLSTPSSLGAAHVDHAAPEGAPTNGTRDVIVELLRHIGSRKEVDQYLRHYAAAESPKVAVVKVGKSTLRAGERGVEGLAASLSFLHRVGLRPVVVLGRGADIASVNVAGASSADVEAPRGADAVRRGFERDALRLADALDAMGTRARPITSGVFDAARVGASDEPGVDPGRHGHAVAAVREDAIASTLRAGLLPVVVPLGETDDGRVVGLDSDEAACALALALRPHKVIFLTETAGLEIAPGEVAAAINLLEDYGDLMDEGRIPAEARARLARIESMLRDLPASSSVSITSPDHLAKELFTHRGSGTLVRMGERVRTHATFDALDTERLKELLERCFGRRLDPAYFVNKTPLQIYLAESYRAAAILTHEGDVPYLDKFAVTTEAQGEGIGGSIWRRLAADHPRFFWRAREGNPINAWYAQKADGFHRAAPWVVFWVGVQDFRDVEACVKRALSLPATLRDHGSGE